MPDPELTAYLDGEADAEATTRLDALLRSDPELRQEALLLLRQRVALVRALAPVPLPLDAPPTGRLWWLAASMVAAACLVLATVIGRDGGRMAEPATASVAPHSDLDGLQPGQAVTITAAQPRAWTLADGSVLTPATGSAMVTPTATAPTLLTSGSLRVDLPHGASATIATSQAVIRGHPPCSFTVEADADGTVVHSLHSECLVGDQVTRLTTPLRPGGALWLPADDAAPAEIDGARGQARGTVEAVTALDRGGKALSLRTRFGVFRFVPEWNVRTYSQDREMSARLARLAPGDAVAIEWRMQEHLRVLAIRLIAPAAKKLAVPATEGRQATQDF